MKLLPTLKWTGVAFILIGHSLTSFDVYPTNLYFTIFGDIFWAASGILMKDLSIVAIPAIMLIIYAAGLIHHFH